MIPIDRAWLNANPLPDPGNHTDKNRRGRVLAVGGSLTVPGALLLTAEAALRAGAGKVQMATAKDVALLLGVRIPEAAIFGLPVDQEGELADSGQEIATMIERCDAAVIGPGMGPKADTASILEALLNIASADKTLILDAAMIAALKNLAPAARSWNGRLILTPHAGELAALMGCEEADVTPQLAEEAAKRFDAIVMLKKAETWIASPEAPTLHYRGGGPGLATGGSGDVLAGIVAGLAARGATPQVATGWSVWLHGEAGRILADRIGRLGFLARELLPQIPHLLRAIPPSDRKDADH